MPPSLPHKIAETILYELWYGVADTLFERVCTVTDLDPERRAALRQIMMRPNDFQVVIDQIPVPQTEPAEED